MKDIFPNFQVPILATFIVLLLGGCRLSTLPEVSEINESIPVGQSRTFNVLVQNDYRESVFFLEETVPEWIEVQGLAVPELRAGQLARLSLTARCGEIAEVRKATIELQSATGSVSKFIKVQIECVDNNFAPFPFPNPLPSPGPQREMGSLRGDPEFTNSKLSDSQRFWYERILGSIGRRLYDKVAASDDLYKYGRDLHTHYQSMLLAFRMTGDLRLLDEIVRLTDIQKSKLHDSWRDTLDGSQQKDGYLNWVWRYDDENKDHYGKDENMLDDIKTHTILTVIAYALAENSDLASPAGYNYAAKADYWRDHLENQFFKKWRERRHKDKDDYRVFVKTGTHTSYSLTKMNLYMYKITGDEGYLGEANHWPKFLWKDIKEVSAPTGPAFVWPKGMVSYDPDTSLNYLQPVVYARYVFADVVDFYFDGFNQWADAANMKKFARTITDFVMIHGNESFARDIGGNKSRGGYPSSDEWIENSRARYQLSPIAHMIAWDASGKMKKITEEVYDIIESDREAPRELYMPVGLFVDAVWNDR